jgi:predicted RNA-binding Zn ribbon-like protein
MQIDEVSNPKTNHRHWSLDFVNTSDWHASPHPEETLHSYADLVNWTRKEGIVSEKKAQRYLHEGTGRPSDADQALGTAIELREIIYRILVTVIKREAPPQADLAAFNYVLGAITCGASVISAGREFEWEWKVDESSLESIVWPIVISTAELLVSEDRQRIKQCEDEQGCGWLFLDQSKNHSRRWCDMKNCGNRAKQRRHYRRGKEITLV